MGIPLATLIVVSLAISVAAQDIDLSTFSDADLHELSIKVREALQARATRFAPRTRKELYAARDEWCESWGKAADKYGPIGQWDVTAVTDLSHLFCATPLTRDCNDNCRNFNDDISAWDTSQVTSMQGMFQHLSIFNRPLPWDTSSVKDLSYLFSLTKAFNQPLDWDTSKVTTMQATFSYASAFNQPLDWDTFVTSVASSVGNGAATAETFTGTRSLSKCNEAKISRKFLETGWGHLWSTDVERACSKKSGWFDVKHERTAVSTLFAGLPLARGATFALAVIVWGAVVNHRRGAQLL